MWHQEGVGTTDLIARCGTHLASQYHRRIINEIYMTPHHAQAIAKYARHRDNARRAVDARELIFRPFEPVDLKNISAECAKLFEDTWVKSHLIKLSRQRGQAALILQPIRVPPIPP